MNAKKIFVGAMILSAMFINISPTLVEADEIEIFGSEFEDDEEISNPFTPPSETVTPPPEETVSPPPEEVTPPQTFTPPPPAEVSPPPTVQPENSNLEDDDDEDFGDELNFNDLNKARTNPPPVVENPVVTNPPIENIPTINPEPENKNQQKPKPVKISPSSSSSGNSDSENSKQKKLKDLKARFIKLTTTPEYIFYLDRDFVRWQKMPYSTTEMMADVWVRIINRNDDILLPESEVAEIILAAEEGKQYRPEDAEVLRHEKYHLQHYYLRPKNRQIQYLVEISDIEGYPQNTINERPYSYTNWEDLVPGSVESRIYFSILKIIGKGRASQDSPVTFADYVEEYGRISIR